MIQNQPNRPPKPFLPATDDPPKPSDAILPQAMASETESLTETGLNTSDQRQILVPPVHGSAANLLRFAVTEPAAEFQNPSPELQQLQQLFQTEGSTDPALETLIAAVRQQEDQHIKALLQMMQESLDRAREMQEENKRHFYAKTLPQLQALERVLKQTQQQEESAVESMRQIHNNEVGQLLQALQHQLSQNSADPLVQALSSRLNLIRQGRNLN